MADVVSNASDGHNFYKQVLLKILSNVWMENFIYKHRLEDCWSILQDWQIAKILGTMKLVFVHIKIINNVYFTRDPIDLTHFCRWCPIQSMKHRGNKETLTEWRNISTWKWFISSLNHTGSLVCINYTLPGRVVISFIISWNILGSFHLRTLKKPTVNHTWA